MLKLWKMICLSAQYRCGGERTGAGQTTEDHILVVDIDVIQGGFNLQGMLYVTTQ